jgi:FtsZ-binding cell division protein ZapB
MEILEQLGDKIKKAVSKIEQLEARVKELEGINNQYEQKMKDLLQEMEPITAVEPEQETAEPSVGEQKEESQSFYRQQF